MARGAPVLVLVVEARPVHALERLVGVLVPHDRLVATTAHGKRRRTECDRPDGDHRGLGDQTCTLGEFEGGSRVHVRSYEPGDGRVEVEDDVRRRSWGQLRSADEPQDTKADVDWTSLVGLDTADGPVAREDRRPTAPGAGCVQGQFDLDGQGGLHAQQGNGPRGWRATVSDPRKARRSERLLTRAARYSVAAECRIEQ